MGSPSWSLQRHIHQKAHPCSRVQAGFSARLQTPRRGIHTSPSHMRTHLSFHIISYLFLKLYSVSLCFPDMCVGLENDVWLRSVNSGGGEISQQDVYFFVVWTRWPQEQREDGWVLIARFKGTTLEGVLPWNQLFQHKVGCWGKGNLRPYWQQKESVNRNSSIRILYCREYICF